jgi:Ca2+/Na+ antiporter
MNHKTVLLLQYLSPFLLFCVYLIWYFEIITLITLKIIVFSILLVPIILAVYVKISIRKQQKDENITIDNEKKIPNLSISDFVPYVFMLIIIFLTTFYFIEIIGFMIFLFEYWK